MQVQGTGSVHYGFEVSSTEGGFVFRIGGLAKYFKKSENSENKDGI